MRHDLATYLTSASIGSAGREHRLVLGCHVLVILKEQRPERGYLVLSNRREFVREFARGRQECRELVLEPVQAREKEAVVVVTEHGGDGAVDDRVALMLFLLIVAMHSALSECAFEERVQKDT